MPTTIEFEVDGWLYQASRMDARTQLTLARKTAPIIAAGLGDLVPIVVEAFNNGTLTAIIKKVAVEQAEEELAAAERSDPLPLDKLSKILLPIAEQLSKLPEDDMWLILGSCLSRCQRKRANSNDPWVSIWNASTNRAMSDDINDDAALTLRIAWPVFAGNLRGFFRAGPLGSFAGGLR
jgi:hypothetical protein